MHIARFEVKSVFYATLDWGLAAKQLGCGRDWHLFSSSWHRNLEPRAEFERFDCRTEDSGWLPTENVCGILRMLFYFVGRFLFDVFFLYFPSAKVIFPARTKLALRLQNPALY